MSYLLTLHHDAELTVASCSPVVPPDELPWLQDALALAQRLSELLAREGARLERASADGRQQGWQAGYDAGWAQARTESADALASSLAEVSRAQTAQRQELRRALVTLAEAMVRRMTAALAPADVLAALAERAFEQVVPPQPVRLRLPPDLCEPVQQKLAQRAADARPLPVHCAPDDSLQGLQCVLESSVGTLLAGLDDALARTTEALRLQQRRAAGATPTEGEQP